MLDIKERPKADRPKARSKAAKLPREAGRQLKEKAVRELKNSGDGQQNAGEYAAGRVEAAAQETAQAGGDALHAGLDRFRRRQAAAKKTAAQTQRANTEAGRNASQFETHFDNRQRSYTGRERGYTDELDTPQRRLWREKAVEAHKERIREKGRVAPFADSGGTAAPTGGAKKNASQIETHFDKGNPKQRPLIRERGISGMATDPKPPRPQANKRAVLPKTRVAKGKTVLQQMQRQGRQKAVREAAAKAAKAARRTSVRLVKAAGAAIAKGIGAVLAAGGGGILLVILLFIAAVGAIAASPFGLLFTAEQNGPGTVSAAEAVAQVNADFNAQLAALQAGDYDEVIISGAPPVWTEVLAVFAAKTAGADEGVDVATLDEARVALLKEVFWDMTDLSSEVETIEHSDSDPDDGADDSWTETILTISVSAKTAEEMRSAYAFTGYQNDALTELLAERAALASLVGDLTITNASAKELLAALPEGLSEERREVVRTACTLVGKVNYFWGGKSLVIGWDSRWGQLQKVWADGSPTTGTYRPFGLDCSGFVDWVFYNMTGGDYIIGHGGGAQAQHGYCTAISWSEAQPGDLVFYPGDSHVGIVSGRDENGNLLIIHCASGANNVVITGLEGFTSIGRPDYYGE